MGVPSDDVLAREKERARSEGADPAWLDRMDGGFTGVVGTMHFARKGPVVGIRFDMDSNDVTETDAPEHFPNREGFASCHAGAMHSPSNHKTMASCTPAVTTGIPLSGSVSHASLPH